MTNQIFFQTQSIKTAATHWISFTAKRRKLRKFFEGTPAEDLLLNKLEKIRKRRSAGVSAVLFNFLKSVRERMMARKVLSRSLAAYRSQIPVYKNFK